LATMGLLCAAICAIVPMLLPSYDAYRWMRVASGVGEGAVLAALHASIARLADPDRAFAVCNFALVSVGIVQYPLVAAQIPHYGSNAMLSAILALALIALASAYWLPDPQSVTDAASGGPSALRMIELAQAFRPATLALFAVGIFYVAEGALWGYLYRIGLATGLADVAVGEVISGAFVFSIAGALVAYWLGTRWGRMIPLCVSGSILCFVALVLGNGPAPSIFRLTCYVFYFVFIFVVNYSSSLMAALDVHGRIATATPALRMLGTAIGPAVASTLLSQRDFSGVGWFSCSFYAVATILFFLSGRAKSSGNAPIP
jgi:hypothetical protein